MEQFDTLPFGSHGTRDHSADLESISTSSGVKLQRKSSRISRARIFNSPCAAISSKVKLFSSIFKSKGVGNLTEFVALRRCKIRDTTYSVVKDSMPRGSVSLDCASRMRGVTVTLQDDSQDDPQVDSPARAESAWGLPSRQSGKCFRQ